MRVKALQSMYYSRQMRAPGETYEMDDREESEAKILAALGKIEIIGKEEEKTAPAVAPVAVAASAIAPAETATPPMTTEDNVLTAPKRQYRRRDMKAEK